MCDSAPRARWRPDSAEKPDEAQLAVRAVMFANMGAGAMQSPLSARTRAKRKLDELEPQSVAALDGDESVLSHVDAGSIGPCDARAPAAKRARLLEPTASPRGAVPRASKRRRSLAAYDALIDEEPPLKSQRRLVDSDVAATREGGCIAGGAVTGIDANEWPGGAAPGVRKRRRHDGAFADDTDDDEDFSLSRKRAHGAAAAAASEPNLCRELVVYDGASAGAADDDLSPSAPFSLLWPTDVSSVASVFPIPRAPASLFCAHDARAASLQLIPAPPRLYPFGTRPAAAAARAFTSAHRSSADECVRESSPRIVELPDDFPSDDEGVGRRADSVYEPRTCSPDEQHVCGDDSDDGPVAMEL